MEVGGYLMDLPPCLVNRVLYFIIYYYVVVVLQSVLENSEPPKKKKRVPLLESLRVESNKKNKNKNKDSTRE